MNKAKSLSKVSIKPHCQAKIQQSQYASKIQQQPSVQNTSSSSFISHFAVSNGVPLQQTKKSKSPSVQNAFQTTSSLSSARRMSLKMPTTTLSTLQETQLSSRHFKDLSQNTVKAATNSMTSRNNANSKHSRKRSLNYNSNTSVSTYHYPTKDPPVINITGLQFISTKNAKEPITTKTMGKRKASAAILQNKPRNLDKTNKQSKMQQQLTKGGGHKRITSCQDFLQVPKKRNNLDFLTESAAASTLQSYKMSFRSSMHSDKDNNHDQKQYQSNKYLTINQANDTWRNSQYRSNSQSMLEYNSDPALIGKRSTMNEQQMQEEIAKIRQNQKIKADALIESFNILKKQAMEALDANCQSLYSSQPINLELYEQRMNKFETIIENLVDRQKQTQEELDHAKHVLKSKNSLDLQQTQPTHLNKTTFNNFSPLESSYKSIQSSKNLCKNHNSQSQQSHQQKEQSQVSQSTFDKRDKFNSPNLLDQTMQKKQLNGMLSSIKPSSASTVKNYENVSPDKKLLINAFNLHSHQNQQSHIQSFLDTLQYLEEGKHQSKPELHAIRQRLTSYRDQLKSYSKSQAKNEYNQKLQSLLENIIKKMNSKLDGRSRIEEEENLAESSVEKSHMLLDLSRDLPLKEISRNNQNREKNEQHQCDVSGIIDTSITSSQSNYKQQITCNKSGFLVKHAKNGEPNQYKLDPLQYFEIQQQQEFEDQEVLGWQQEIKHIKTLLGAMALDMDSKLTSTQQLSVKEEREEPPCRIL